MSSVHDRNKGEKLKRKRHREETSFQPKMKNTMGQVDTRVDSGYARMSNETRRMMQLSQL